MTTEKSEEQEIMEQAKADALADAIKLVNAEIDRQRKELEGTTKDEEGFPVALYGETCKKYYVSVQASPSDVAKIMLDYDYPIWNVLGLDAPDAMWDELAEMVGLLSVLSVDIGL